MPGLLLLLIIVVGVVIYVENCYRALPPEFQKIHPKLIWLLEVPVALALFQLPAISFLSNILIHLFIAVAIVLSFEQYFAARQVPSRLFVSFCAAVGVSATQIALLVIGILERVRPGMQPEVSADFLACILLAMYGFFFYSLQRLASRVKSLERDLKKESRKAEVREGLKRSTLQKKGGTAKPGADTGK